MWCYSKPDYAATLLSRLQRQQQHRHFCDTQIIANDIAVPVHGCILSALTYYVPPNLNSTMTPSPGQIHHVELHDLDSYTIFNLVRFLYSGEMIGVGEMQRQAVLSVADKLGINGLVEVNKSNKGVGKETALYIEVGVQTESVITENHENRQNEGINQVSDVLGGLGKDTVVRREAEIGTQTEEQDFNPTLASYETINLSDLRSLETIESQQYVPITIVYPPNENHTAVPYLTAPALAEVPTASGDPTATATAPTYMSALTSQAPFTNHNPSIYQEAGRDEEWEDEDFQEFEGNIPGFIHHFLNPEDMGGKADGPKTKRRGGRRAGSRGEKKPRAPRARGAGRGKGAGRGRSAGRGRGGLTEKVQTQQVGAAKVQKPFLHRDGGWSTRTGQGGGATGRKLFVNSREVQKAAGGRQTRARNKVCEVVYAGDRMEHIARRTTRQRKSPTQQLPQSDLSPVRAQNNPEQPPIVSFPGPSRYLDNNNNQCTSSSLRQPSMSPGSLSPPASNISSATSNPYHPPAYTLAPQEDQPVYTESFVVNESLDGVNPLPNPTASSYPDSTTSSYVPPNKQQEYLHIPEVHVGQQQVETLSVLERFIQSIELQIENGSIADDPEINEILSAGDGQVSTVINEHEKDVATSQPAPHQPNPSYMSEPQSKASQLEMPAETPECCSDTNKKRAKPSKLNRSKSYKLSHERDRKSKKKKSPEVADVQLGSDLNDVKLQQKLMVKLCRRISPPFSSTLQENSCQRPKNKASVKKAPADNKEKAYWETKIYPIRSRFKAVQITDTTPFLKDGFSDEQLFEANKQRSRKRVRPKASEKLCSLGDSEPLNAPVQADAVDDDANNHQSETNEERSDAVSTIQPEVKETDPRVKEKEAACDEYTKDDDVHLIKKIRLYQMNPAPTGYNFKPFYKQSKTNTEPDGMANYVMNGSPQDREAEETPVLSENRQSSIVIGWSDVEIESHIEEFLDGEGLREFFPGCGNSKTLNDHIQDRISPRAFSANYSLTKNRSSPRPETQKDDVDEEIDVVGACTPVPETVDITWTDDSEQEEVDVDDFEENTGLMSLAMIAAMQEDNTVHGIHQMEVFSH